MPSDGCKPAAQIGPGRDGTQHSVTVIQKLILVRCRAIPVEIGAREQTLPVAPGGLGFDVPRITALHGASQGVKARIGAPPFVQYRALQANLRPHDLLPKPLSDGQLHLRLGEEPLALHEVRLQGKLQAYRQTFRVARHQDAAGRSQLRQHRLGAGNLRVAQHNNRDFASGDADDGGIGCFHAETPVFDPKSRGRFGDVENASHGCRQLPPLWRLQPSMMLNYPPFLLRAFLQVCLGGDNIARVERLISSPVRASVNNPAGDTEALRKRPCGNTFERILHRWPDL